MEELLSESPRVGGFMHHFMGWFHQYCRW
jgi:hypothetical protein